MREGSYKMVKWVLGAYNAVVTRLRRSLTPEFISTPSDNAGDVQSGIGGVPAGRVAWPVGTASHDGASFVGCDAFPAKYVHKDKKVYLLDTLGKRHYGAKPLEVGKNVELAGGIESDSDGVVVRGAEFGDAQKVVGGPKLANNIFYPAGSKLIAHHLQPDPPTQSSQVYDVDGRKGGLHYPLRVREWLVKIGTGLLGAKQAGGFLPKIFAPLFNFTENGDGTPAHGAAHFADSEAVLSAERGGPLRPADDGNHELGKTSDAKVNQGANDIDVLYGPIRALYGPEELVDEQWENGSKGPYIKRVEKRPDFTDRHPNAFGLQVPMKIKWQTWDNWNTYPTIPPPPETPPPDKPPVPPTAPPPVDVPPRDVFPKPMPNPVPGFPGQGAATRPEYGNAPPVTSTPNEVGVPSEYGEPVPGTPEPRVPVPSGISRFMEGHNFTEEERVKQGRVGHSVYAPVYKSNTAGAGSTAAQRWPVSYTSEGKLYVAANGRVLAIERPYYASGAKITLAPEMERQHQFVANKETWPTTLSAFYTIFGAGKNTAGVELIGGFGIGLRVPNMYLPASGWYFKLDYTDGNDVPDLDIRSTDSAGLDASTGRMVKINGTAISSGSGDFVGPSASIAESIVAFDGTTGKLGKQGRMMFGTPSVGAGDTADSETLMPMRPVLSSGHGINAIIQGQPGTVGDSDGGGVFILAAAGSGFGAAGTVGVGNSGSLKEVLIGQSGKTTTISGNFALPNDDVQVSEGGTGASTAPTALSNLGGFGTPIALANLAMM